ncbi:MAG: hypothetical protein AB7S38_02505 [Vulcanimicrobiota bacterium]
MDSGLDHLLRELTDAGTVDSGGVFTIDLTEALAKMRRYQLEGRNAYLQALVAAAVLGRASRFSLEQTGSSLVISFDGDTIPGSQLQTVFSYLLISEPVSRMRELAVALNSLLGGEYERLLVQAWAGLEGAQLEVEGSEIRAHKLTACPWSPEESINRITLVRRRTLGGMLKPLATEREFLAGKCSLAPLELTTGGAPVPRAALFPNNCLALAGLVNRDFPLGLELPKVVARSAGPSPGDFTALIALTSKLTPQAQMHFVVSGVTFERVVGFDLPGVVAVIATDRLEKNFSQTDLVSGTEFHRMISQLGFEGIKLTAVLAQKFNQLSAAEQTPATKLILKAMAAALTADSWGPGFPTELAGLVDAPLFFSAAGNPVSLRPFLQQYRLHGRLLYVRKTQAVDKVGDETVILMDPETGPVLEAVFPRREDYQQQLLEQAESSRSVARPPAEVLEPVKLSKLKGFISENPDGAFAPARLCLRRDPRTVVGQKEPGLPDGLLVEVWCREVDPSYPLDEPPNRQYYEPILARVRAELPRFYKNLTDVSPSAWEKSDSPARHHLLNLLAWLGPYDGEPPKIGMLVHIETLRTVQGGMLSLSDLLKDYDKRRFVGVISSSLPMGDLRGGDLPTPLTLSVNAQEQACLEKVFGEYGLHHYDDLLKFRKARPEFFTRTLTDPVLADDMVWRVSFEDRDIQGEVGYSLAATDPRLRARLLVYGRLMEEWDHELGFGPVVAVVACPRLRPNSRWNGVAQDKVFAEVRDALLEHARRLVFSMEAELVDPFAPNHLRARRFAWSQMVWELRRFHEDVEKYATEETFRRFCRLPLLFDLWGEPRCLEELMPETRTVRTVGYLSGPVDRPKDPETIVLKVEPDELRSLRTAFKLLDIPPLDLALALGQQERREARLGEGVYLHQGSTAPLEGEVALLGGKGPSRVTILCDHRLLREHTLESPFPFEAVLNHDGAATSLRVQEATIEQARLSAERLVLELIDRQQHRLYLLELLSRLTPGPLWERLRSAPLVRDLVSWGLVAVERLEPPVVFLPNSSLEPNQARAAQKVAAQRGVPVLPVLDESEQKLLFHLLDELQPLGRDFLTSVQALHNQQGQRRTSFRLEDVYPGKLWLGRVPFTGDRLLGELGLPLDEGPGELSVSVEGLPIANLELGEPGLFGVIDGPFPVRPDWSGLLDEEAVRYQLVEAQRQLAKYFSHSLPLAPKSRSRALRALTALRGTEPAPIAPVRVEAIPDYEVGSRLTQDQAARLLTTLRPSLAHLAGKGALVLAPLGSRGALYAQRPDGLALNSDHPLLPQIFRHPRGEKLGLQLLALLLAGAVEQGSAREAHRQLLNRLGVG